MLDKEEFLSRRTLAWDRLFSSWQGPQETVLAGSRKLGKSKSPHLNEKSRTGGNKTHREMGIPEQICSVRLEISTDG